MQYIEVYGLAIYVLLCGKGARLVPNLPVPRSWVGGVAVCGQKTTQNSSKNPLHRRVYKMCEESSKWSAAYNIASTIGRDMVNRLKPPNPLKPP